ncbi:hypothetical protein [Streptomyces sp. NBC_00690]|nr:hypothetical protein [Streptomyces sp. NBC_00690]
MLGQFVERQWTVEGRQRIGRGALEDGELGGSLGDDGDDLDAG